ncbi:amidohydrolase [Anaerovorax odorimutans]|uniref:Amidohydrolase n=1 Tax=Anaerovorax odorimutans TaxID=109327 RepID=A0ABT1RTC8_9FIRM|nr:amidohydrolase [Anaerovorax odorimutans]MCQ4638464.1 amidohydrolase [Anaerovorax odorimutans]
MLFNNITIIDENFQAAENMYVGIDGQTITYISKEAPKKAFGRVYDGKGKLLMSGFVNTHAHSPMTLMRGYGENLALQDWLNKKIFPFEAKLTGEAVYWATMLAMAESIRFGIVSTTDMYYFSEAMVKAIEESGAKNNISRSITCFDDSDLFDLDGAKEMKALYENHHNGADGRIKVDMSIHAEYTSTPKVVRQMAEYTSSIGANMHVHLSETQTEHEECKQRHGMTPAAYFNKLGLFDTPATAAHCVWIEGEDFDILKEKGVTVASNPVSNMKLASGVCNVPKLLDKGIRVSLGTDSVASNNSLNFIEEMKYLATAAKERLKDPTAVTPAQALQAATRAGALSQGRDDCGLLKTGYRADLIVLDISGPHMHPIHDLCNNVVYSASGSDVIMTMADGKILYENGRYFTIDLEKTIYEAGRATKKILQAL